MASLDWRHYAVTAIIMLVIGYTVQYAYYSTRSVSENKATEKEINNAIETGNALISNGAYEEAANEFEIILAKISSNEFPDKFIDLQNSLGIAYYALGSRKDEQANLEKAIRAYQNGLTIATVDRYPEDYALLNNNIGNAYSMLALYRDNASNLMRAMDAYDKSLDVYTKERYPKEYEQVQNQKMLAFQSLLETNDTLIDEEYAYKQYSIGYTFLKASMVDGNQPLAESAIRAFKEALRVYSPQKNAEYYASTSNALGSAYMVLSDTQDQESNLEKAIEAYQNALLVYNLENYPGEYGIAHMNLGTAFSSLSYSKDRESNLEKAIQSNKEALKVFYIDQDFAKDLRSRIERDQNKLSQ